MIPVGPIAAALAARNRGNRPSANLGGFFRALVWFWLCVTLAIVAPWRALSAGFAVAALLAVPPIPLTLVALPLGLVRFAWAIERAFGGSFAPFEGRVGPALTAARALLRRPDERGARFIEAYLETCIELAGGGLLASAYVALARGDRDRARRLAQALASTAHDVVPAALVRDACELVALDAIARGDWAAVKRPPWLGGLGGRVRLYAAIAEYAQAEPGARSPARLWLRWLVAGRRHATWPLVRWAIALPPPAPAALVAASLEAHVALLTRVDGAASPARPADVAAAVASLDGFRGAPGVLANIQRRALALGGGAEGAIARDEVVGLAEAEIAFAVLDGDLPVACVPAGATGDSVRATVRERRVGAVETLVAEMHRRSRQKADLPEADEWCAWLELRVACDALLRDATDPFEWRRVFFQIFHPLTHYAVRLINARTMRVLARDICVYIRDLAHLTGASEHFALVDKNAAACLADRLPRVDGVVEGALGHAKRTARVRAAIAGIGLLGVGGGFLLSPVTPYGLVPGFALLVGMALLQQRLVNAHESPDGLTLQTMNARFIALPDNVEGVHAGPGPVVRIRLRRSPRWLARRVVLVAASRREARAVAARIAAYGNGP
jgi:hypothetical protein